MSDERMSDERMSDERMSDERMSDERMLTTHARRAHVRPARVRDAGIDGAPVRGTAARARRRAAPTADPKRREAGGRRSSHRPSRRHGHGHGHGHGQETCRAHAPRADATALDGGEHDAAQAAAPNGSAAEALEEDPAEEFDPVEWPLRPDWWPDPPDAREVLGDEDESGPVLRARVRRGGPAARRRIVVAITSRRAGARPRGATAARQPPTRTTGATPSVQRGPRSGVSTANVGTAARRSPNPGRPTEPLGRAAADGAQGAGDPARHPPLHRAPDHPVGGDPPALPVGAADRLITGRPRCSPPGRRSP